jgi:hypothetical protein
MNSDQQAIVDQLAKALGKGDLDEKSLREGLESALTARGSERQDLLYLHASSAACRV